jgi:hypothetical protein
MKILNRIKMNPRFSVFNLNCIISKKSINNQESKKSLNIESKISLNPESRNILEKFEENISEMSPSMVI